MRKIYTLLYALALMTAQQAKAETWSYDFEDFASIIGDNGPRVIDDIVINGLTWHIHGVNPSKDYTDWANGNMSMRLYSTTNKDRNKGNEIVNFTLASPRDIGTVSFMIRSAEGFEDYQASWIVQWSADGSTWVTVGDAFTATGTPEQITRVVNQKNSYMRIVRADYDTFDYENNTNYGPVTNFDDMSITDAEESQVVFSSSTSALDFGTLTLGETKEDTFYISHKGGEAEPQYSLSGSDQGSFSYEVKSGEETDTVSVTCTARRRSAATAFIDVKYAGSILKVTLNYVGEKADPNMLFSGGEGTEASPYLITCPEDLDDLSFSVEYEYETFSGKYFKMTNDITLNIQETFRPIGNNFNSSNEQRPFSGIFDGDGHTVSGLNVYFPDNLFEGMFGIINGAVIKNLTIANSKFYGVAGIGAFVGAAIGDTKLQNLHTEGDVAVTATYYYAGGICAGALVSGNCHIADCTNAATVTSSYGDAAGILATNGLEGTVVERCGNSGEITDYNYNVGGVVCSTDAGMTIRDCYNSGTVNMYNQQEASNLYGGGILGAIGSGYYDGLVTIANCYNIGTFSSIIPNLHPIFNIDMIETGVDMSNCYFASDINGNSYDAGVEGTPCIVIENSSYMQTEDFVKDLNCGSEEGVWVLKEGKNYGFPVPEGTVSDGVSRIRSEKSVAIAIQDGRVVVDGSCDSVKVYDMSGREMSSNNVMGPGMYVVKVTIGGKTYTRKVMRR